MFDEPANDPLKGTKDDDWRREEYEECIKMLLLRGATMDERSSPLMQELANTVVEPSGVAMPGEWYETDVEDSDTSDLGADWD